MRHCQPCAQSKYVYPKYAKDEDIVRMRRFSHDLARQTRKENFQRTLIGNGWFTSGIAGLFSGYWPPAEMCGGQNAKIAIMRFLDE